MAHRKKSVSLLFGIFAAGVLIFAIAQSLNAAQQPATSATKTVGTIKALTASSLILTPDSGDEMEVLIQDKTRLLQVAPGATTLKDATPISLQDLQVGDRIRVTGKTSSENSKLVDAATVVAMKLADVRAKQEHDRDDWTKRGVGGIVTAVDSDAGSLTISVSGGAQKKMLLVHTTKQTAVRRYAPDSIKFEDAKRGPLSNIKPGDQLRARGSRSSDGNELDAEEIVSGTFRNITGTILSTDTNANTLNIQELATKKAVLVKLTVESKLQKLPSAMAQRAAARIKGTANNAPQSATQSQENSPAGMASAQDSPRMDLQQFLSRAPGVALADLQKGEAVMIVSTEGTAGGVTAITVLCGVEPLLEASSKGGQTMMLSPWSLGSSGGEGEAP